METNDFGDIRVLVDNGTEKSRKVIDITSSTLPNIQKQALIGLHAVSGNDSVPSFFRKGRIAFWKAMLKRAEFIELFDGLGVTTDLSGTSALNIEKVVCFLYGDQRIASVDELRHKMFCQKIEKELKSRRPQPLASLQIKPPNPHNTSKLCCPDVPPSK